MYKNLVKYFVYGLLATYVPLNLMGTHFHQANVFTKNNFPFINIIRYTPIIFGIINVIVFSILHWIGIKNFFLIGAIFSLIYSSMGRWISEVPQRVFEMDPNQFQLQALIVWVLFYGIFIQFIDYFL